MLKRITNLFKANAAQHKVEIARLEALLKSSLWQTKGVSQRFKTYETNAEETIATSKQRIKKLEQLLEASEAKYADVNQECIDHHTKLKDTEDLLENQRVLTKTIHLKYNTLRSRVSIALNLADEER